MVETIPQELVSTLEELRKQVALLSERIAILEDPAAAVTGAVSPTTQAGMPVPQVTGAVPPTTQAGMPVPQITQEELLAISGALAAYLGVRVHIKQVRLISSRVWASEGRASIQASHQLHS